jgi:hypothetical protein
MSRFVGSALTLKRTAIQQPNAVIQHHTPIPKPTPCPQKAIFREKLSAHRAGQNQQHYFQCEGIR